MSEGRGIPFSGSLFTAVGFKEFEQETFPPHLCSPGKSAFKDKFSLAFERDCARTPAGFLITQPDRPLPPEAGSVSFCYQEDPT